MALFKKFIPFFLLCIPVFLTLGCAVSSTSLRKCTILFEDNDNIYLPNQIYEISYNQDLKITLGIPIGERIASINYEDYTLSPKIGSSQSYDYYDLTLNHLKYSTIIKITTAASYTTTYFYEKDIELETIIETSPHLYFNTLMYNETYYKEGYLPLGWNTKPDGSGISIGFGSRFDHSSLNHMNLYLEWIKVSPSSDFTYNVHSNNQIRLTSYTGSGNLIIPSHIDGYEVTSISSNAFLELNVEYLVFPPTLKEIEKLAFSLVTATHLYFFDKIDNISENAFLEYHIKTIHINASTPPVYSGTYFDTFPDKVDYLSSIKDQTKIILFAGSSTRFGYDSSMIESAFPDYKVANMGVYAYSNMLPQGKIILHYLNEGDLLIHSPEFDTINTQFCSQNFFHKETFCMLESNYDLLTLIDCNDFTSIFSAFQEYNESRKNMSARSYLESPSYYDEDGNLQATNSYNKYGDYIVYRENNESKKLFGIKRAYYHPAYFSEEDFQGINQLYQSFLDKGAKVFFTYSPRSKESISADSTKASILSLEELLNKKLIVPIMSSIEDSLIDSYYFYGTDNHLSTEGVFLHTTKMIADLKKTLESE